MDHFEPLKSMLINVSRIINFYSILNMKYETAYINEGLLSESVLLYKNACVTKFKHNAYRPQGVSAKGFYLLPDSIALKTCLH